MNAIEKIISQMNEAAEQERAALEQEERMKIDQNFEQKRTQVETEHQKQKEKQIELLEKKYRQLRNRQQVEVRQENLNAKQEFLRRLFADAVTEMENWDEYEQIQFIKNALYSLPLTGKVAFFAGEKSAAYLSQTLLDEWNNELPFMMVLSDETVADQAGFLINDQGVQYNFLFSSLVQDIQGTMSFEIANQLFE
ncbi:MULTISPECIES: V-type proton ATPase subunit E [Enterococcus]|uniref:V-type proton ATPase subunit E n=1 Tax=Enterococcus TaxID=1350 RepID=UPI00215C860D|nr:MULTISPECIES: V-type proton ATPase subunit E [Enterococcus]MCR9045904.1 V-type proton ATPase subunit E [Enterococcus faecium]MDQ8604948.1 V-type proton ATPase subunit E [Enterococcus sp. FR202]MDQ8615443.1 V-type proton ATPase subunit E [Enterococcus sp. FR165]MDQ8628121.1 V-type proton ATPase subunit E [Enterococcus sp. FR204]MDQ8647113.1 V-type proton ATPase subunit E [Enterococcus sp. FR208]